MMGIMLNKTAPKYYYQAIIETPIAPMIAVADDFALYALLFVEQRKINVNFKPGRSKPIDAIEQELALYFAGQLKIFKTPLEMVGTDFQKNVWRELQKIPFGQTRSYVDVSTAMGKPTAFRALANANGANSLAIIIPCHRVINHNGALGGYNGGLDRKRALLNLEGVNNDAF